MWYWMTEALMQSTDEVMEFRCAPGAWDLQNKQEKKKLSYEESSLLVTQLLCVYGGNHGGWAPSMYGDPNLSLISNTIF